MLLPDMALAILVVLCHLHAVCPDEDGILCWRPALQGRPRCSLAQQRVLALSAFSFS